MIEELRGYLLLIHLGHVQDKQLICILKGREKQLTCILKGLWQASVTSLMYSAWALESFNLLL